jgi:hypothetical protein
MKHVLGTPFYTLRIPIAQVADVYFLGDRVQEYRRILASPNAKAAAIAPVFIHPHHPNLFIPGEGISLAGRKALLALDAEERRVDSFFFQYSDFNPGSPRIKLLFVRKGADLFADTTTAAFLMINIDFGSALARYHFRTSSLDLLCGNIADLSQNGVLSIHLLSIPSVLFFSSNTTRATYPPKYALFTRSSFTSSSRLAPSTILPVSIT